MTSTVNNVVIKQGDISDTFQVSPFVEGEAVQNLSDPGWTCRSVIINKVGGDVIVDNAVTAKTADDLYFETQLAPPDTDVLDVKGYIWVIQIENLITTPIYRKEHHINLSVEAEGALVTGDTYTEYDITSIGTVANPSNLYVVVTADHTPPGSIRYMLLKDEDGVIIQRVGYVSSATNGSDKEITLLEPVCGSPTTITYVSS